ncbi:hypothetical protein M3Y97_00690600 [Aphelenchoides bicaudatus]|nr:hypothetical protein M3Y97_00690600 [Aphelenchoides bicaudatus]
MANFFENMKLELLEEFQKGTVKTYKQALTRINKKRKKDGNKAILPDTAKRWWTAFKNGDFDVKRKYLDNCSLKIEGIRWTHSCRIERDDESFQSLYFDGRFLFEANSSNSAGEMCIIDTFHGIFKVLKYTVKEDDPRLPNFAANFQHHQLFNCLTCRKERKDQEATVKKDRPPAETAEPAKYLGWCPHIVTRFMNDRRLCLREAKPLGQNQIAIVDYSSFAMLTMQLDFQAGTIELQSMEEFSKETPPIRRTQTILQDGLDPTKFLLLQDKRDFGNLLGLGEFDPFTSTFTFKQENHQIQLNQIEIDDSTYAPKLMFAKVEGKKVFGLGGFSPQRSQQIDLSRLYVYDLEQQQVEVQELIVPWPDKNMKILGNGTFGSEQHPHAWVHDRLYVCSRFHVNNKTSIIVLSNQEWTDLKINVNGSITAILRSTALGPFDGYSEGILLVRVQKKVPKLQHISRYVRIPTCRPDCLIVLAWTRIRNYCEKRPKSVTSAINELIPPILQCPFAGTERAQEVDNPTTKTESIDETEQQQADQAIDETEKARDNKTVATQKRTNDENVNQIGMSDV